jgi:glycosyltransferase involved in cell wall biosynthesis
MRILIVAHLAQPYPEAGGMGAKVDVASRWLAARDHAVTVATTDHGPRPAGADSPGPENVYLPVLTKYRRIGLGLAAVRFAAERVRTFDVVHVHGYYDLLSPLIMWHARRAGVPYLIEPEGALPPAGRSIRKKRLYMATLGRPSLRGARVVLATSERERADLMGLAGDVPVVLRRNGVAVPVAVDRDEVEAWRARVLGDSDARLVVFLGRICRVKALSELVQGCALAGVPAVVVLAGPDDGDGTRDEVIAGARRAGIHVVMPGPVSGNAKWALLAAADVCALPSWSDSFGLAAAEAMAVGVPVLVSRHTGIAPLVARTGAGVVVETEPQAIAQGLRSMLADDAVHAQMSRNALQAARTLDWCGPLEHLERLYRWAASDAAAGLPQV